MGGALGGLFSSVGQGSNFNTNTGTFDPSTAQKLVQGVAKGTGAGFGQSMQRPPVGGGSGTPGAPSATPVDAGYFTPNSLPPSAMPPGAGGMRAGLPPSTAGPSPFYAMPQ
jgi:hypothetical protein